MIECKSSRLCRLGKMCRVFGPAPITRVRIIVSADFLLLLQQQMTFDHR